MVTIVRRQQIDDDRIPWPRQMNMQSLEYSGSQRPLSSLAVNRSNRDLGLQSAFLQSNAGASDSGDAVKQKPFEQSTLLRVPIFDNSGVHAQLAIAGLS